MKTEMEEMYILKQLKAEEALTRVYWVLILDLSFLPY
jgi:hypothetical protein